MKVDIVRGRKDRVKGVGLRWRMEWVHSKFYESKLTARIVHVRQNSGKLGKIFVSMRVSFHQLQDGNLVAGLMDRWQFVTRPCYILWFCQGFAFCRRQTLRWHVRWTIVMYVHGVYIYDYVQDNRYNIMQPSIICIRTHYAFVCLSDRFRPW